MFRALDQYDLLEEEYGLLADLFEALDLGMDGKVQIDEVISVLVESGLFLQNGL